MAASLNLLQRRRRHRRMQTVRHPSPCQLCHRNRNRNRDHSCTFVLAMMESILLLVMVVLSSPIIRLAVASSSPSSLSSASVGSGMAQEIKSWNIHPADIAMKKDQEDIDDGSSYIQDASPAIAQSHDSASMLLSGTSTNPNVASFSAGHDSNNSGGGWFGKILGGSGGGRGVISGNSQNIGLPPSQLQQQQQHIEQQQSQLPPPPPPPPPPSDGKSITSSTDQSALTHQQQPQPPLKQQQPQPQPQQQQQRQDPRSYNNASPPWNLHRQQQPQQQQPPPRLAQKQQPQQQQQQPLPINNNNHNFYYNTPNNINNNMIIDRQTYQSLLYELDESTIREMTLTHQLQNVSSHVSSLTCETQYLTDRVDTLSERLADVNANYHAAHSRNVELLANCTTLSNMVERLQRELEANAETVSEKEETERELRSELRRATDELERLACLVETERFEEETMKFMQDLKEKQMAKRMKMKKKKRGFWAWFFGWGDGGGNGGSFITADEEEDDGGLFITDEEERRRAARELSRTTLLHALRTERSNVEELESALSALQRNNSAIVDVVASRDSIISELNDRVAVFEEDKMVLKAALRQLRAEIKEEAPRTEQLVRDLEEAREREVELMEELDGMLEDHRLEREEWESQLANLTKEQNKTKEELELIGLYVDQLEDRLANFAIARRELEVREQECDRLGKIAKEKTEIGLEYKRQLDVLIKDNEETKALLEELVTERAETRTKMEALSQEINEWKDRLDEAERRSEEIKSQSARQLFLQIEEEKESWEQALQQKLADERRAWNVEQEKALELAVANEKAKWEAEVARDNEVRSKEEQAELERNLMNEWTARLEQQQVELENQFLSDLQGKLDEERSIWEESKVKEINKRLAEEKALWEKEVENKRILGNADLLSSSLSEEVEKAAAKVFARLEESGVSFGAIDPTLGQLKDMFSKPSKDDDDDDMLNKSMDDMFMPGNSMAGEYTSDVGEKEEEEDKESVRKEPGLATEEESTSVDSSTRADRFNWTRIPFEKNLLAQAPQHPHSSPRKVHPRSVPFRAIRKAFSRSTGLHGLVTPSTAQLRQKMQKQAGQQRRQHSDLNIPYSDEGASSFKMEQLSDLSSPLSDDEAESSDRPEVVHWEPPALPEMDGH